MNFKEAYASLEKEFAQRVEEDKAHGRKCIFLPNSSQQAQSTTSSSEWNPPLAIGQKGRVRHGLSMLNGR
jgi:hypothetical protein